jgi:hypothetical protein
MVILRPAGACQFSSTSVARHEVSNPHQFPDNRALGPRTQSSTLPVMQSLDDTCEMLTGSMGTEAQSIGVVDR